MDKIIFIIGVGRSGTSLLQSMLNAHSQVAFTPETHFFRKYCCSSKKEQWENKGPENFATILQNDKELERLDLEVAAIIRPFLRKEKAFLLEHVYARILELYLKKKKKNIIGDKDPRNIDFLPRIHRLLKDAKIIHIYRDPRDIVLSKTKADWSAHRPFWQHALIGQAQIRKGRAVGRKLFRDRYFEFSYESLISSPEKILKEICTFLSIDFEPGMLNFSRSSKELVSEKEMQWKKETFKPVQKNNKEKWKSGLTPQQIKVVETVSREYFDYLGYEKSNVKALNIHALLLSAGLPLFEWLYNNLLSKRS